MSNAAWTIPDNANVPMERKHAIHFSDPRPGKLGEIMCGTAVESTKQWTRRGAEVTCAECARKMRLTSSSAGAESG